MDMVFQSLYVSAGMLWKALWALMFGYIISSAIQLAVTHGQMAKALGERKAVQTGLASFFGFVSSSCSFAALAASRAIWVKGAHPVNSIAFLIASTNLVIELGIVLWVLLGWKFFAANFLLGLFMIAYAFVLTGLFFPKGLAEEGHKKAEKAQEHSMKDMKLKEGVRSFASLEGWKKLSHKYFMEWKMVYKEILIGFTVAGAISTFVPDAFWSSLFMKVDPQSFSFFAVFQNALTAPFVAFLTFIGSMGNVPLAAMLWSKGVSFAGVMSFLGADLVAAAVIYVNHKYYGWKYTGYLSALLYICMVLAGITVHYLFFALGGVPESRPSLGEIVKFGIDYTFFLNLFFITVSGWLFYLKRRAASEMNHEKGLGEKAA